MTNNRPLSHLRVIDFGQYVAGPAAAMMLADLGAEVIHIDPPGGPRWKSPAADALNRGKSCIELDLRQPKSRRAAQGLIATADVVIENFRPGVMTRMGLDAEELCTRHPHLVWLSLPGFSSKDAPWRDVQAWESIVAAACGQYSDMGLNRVLMGVEPSFSPLPLASGYASVLGAGAVTLALSQRETTGQGDRIEVPLASALMEGLAYNSQDVENYPERYKSNREREIDRRRAEGIAMDASYSQLQELLDPFYRNYECADGRQLYVVSASHNKHPERVLRLLGLWDQLLEEGLPRHSAYLNVSDWPDECTLHSYPLSQAWADRVSDLMKQAFRQKTAFEWEQLFGEAGAPAAAQRTTEEWLASEHARQAGLIVSVDDPRHGPMLQLGPLVWLGSESGLAAEPVPRKVVSLADIPSREAFKIHDKANIDRLTGGWVAGLKVLDLTNVIAGPTIGSTLSRFGAAVISIDPVSPTMDPWNTIIFGMHAGRGKQSLLLDLKSEQGQVILTELLRWADVVTVNATEKQLTGMGLGPERLKQVNPRLILCQLDCYGGPRTGPRSNYPGYDDLAQASTGIMARFGGGLDTPEEHAHFGTIDVLAGFCGVLAIGAALIQRSKTGQGDIARCSLAAAGQLIQSPFMYSIRDRDAFDEPSGRAVRGWGPLYHAYPASDGWFFLATTENNLRSLVVVTGLNSLDKMNPEQQVHTLSHYFQQRTRAENVQLLRGAGLGAQSLQKMQAVRDTHKHIESENTLDLFGPTFAFVRHDHHPSGRWVDLVAPNAIRPTRATITIPSPMPQPGSDSRTVLERIGYSETQISALIEAGLVAEHWSQVYLPE